MKDLVFENVNGLAIATAPTGLKVIAVVAGIEGGCANFNPFNADDRIKLMTGLVLTM